MESKKKQARGPSALGTTKEAPTGEVLRERITAQAYELYLERGQSNGHELEDWLEAERLVAREVEADARAESDVFASANQPNTARRKPASH